MIIIIIFSYNIMTLRNYNIYTSASRRVEAGALIF
jgi:hypothetical protein